MDKTGFTVGPSFRGVKGLNVGKTTSRFSAEVLDPRNWIPSRFQPPCLIHPAVLDVFVHLLISSTADWSSNGMIKARVPVSATSLYVSADFDSTAGTAHVGYCSTRAQGVRGLMSDVVALDPAQQNKPVIILQGCQTVPLRGVNAEKSDAESSSLGHIPCITTLAPDVELVDAPQLDRLLSSATTSRVEVGGLLSYSKTALERFVALFAQKYPGLDIYEHDHGEDEGLLTSLLASLSEEDKAMRLVGSYALARSTPEPAEGTYDMVILNKVTQESSGDGTVTQDSGSNRTDLSQLKKLLKP